MLICECFRCFIFFSFIRFVLVFFFSLNSMCTHIYMHRHSRNNRILYLICVVLCAHSMSHTHSVCLCMCAAFCARQNTLRCIGVQSDSCADCLCILEYLCMWVCGIDVRVSFLSVFLSIDKRYFVLYGVFFSVFILYPIQSMSSVCPWRFVRNGFSFLYSDKRKKKFYTKFVPSEWCELIKTTKITDEIKVPFIDIIIPKQSVCVFFF